MDFNGVTLFMHLARLPRAFFILLSVTKYLLQSIRTVKFVTDRALLIFSVCIFETEQHIPAVTVFVSYIFNSLFSKVRLVLPSGRGRFVDKNFTESYNCVSVLF